jgi:hypothetical protein
MPRGPFIVLFTVVSAAATAALMLGPAAVRDGDGVLKVAAAVTAVVAIIGIVLLARVVIVVERLRRRR